jgi:hypothetical protein
MDVQVVEVIDPLNRLGILGFGTPNKLRWVLN